MDEIRRETGCLARASEQSPCIRGDPYPSENKEGRDARDTEVAEQLGVPWKSITASAGTPWVASFFLVMRDVLETGEGSIDHSADEGEPHEGLQRMCSQNNLPRQ